MTKLRYLFPLLLFAEATLGQDWPSCGAVDVFPAQTWQLSSPAAHGWNEDKLAAARGLFESLESAAVMIVHRGHLIADWGDTAQKFTAQSVRKSLVSSLVGIAIEEKQLRLDATLEELGIDDTKPPLTPLERQATLEHLLLSRSGIMHPALYEVGGWKRMREAIYKDKLQRQDDTYAPGNYWVYNNWDFNAVGTIVEKASGEPIGPLFLRRIAQPLKMQDFEPSDVAYTSKESVTEVYLGNWSEHRAYVFDISTRDLARYGVLYLNCGRWDGTTIVPERWVRQSITGIDTGKGRLPEFQETGYGDYGYMWQVDREGSRRYQELATPEPFYMATGNRGHVLLIMPYLDLVIAHQVATVGGIGFEAQKKRAQFGSPSVDDQSMQALIKAIIAAHPDA